MFPINSEIRRYYWQDFSLQRTMAMPLVLAAIVYLMYLGDSRAGTIASFASTSFVILVFFWGGYKAASCVTEEVKDNTWDNQRLSPVSPLSLSLGKLFGSTLYTWYGGVMALGIYIIYSLKEKPAELVIYNSALGVVLGIFCHAVALLLSIQSLGVRNRYGRVQSITCWVGSLLVVWSLYKGQGGGMSDSFHHKQSLEFVEWFGMEILSTKFWLGSLLAYLAWAIIGIYRLMREELRIKNIPWVWGLFVVFIMVYNAGLFNEARSLKFASDMANGDSVHNYSMQYMERTRLGIAVICGILSMYLIVFMDNINITRYRMIWHQWKQRNWVKIGEVLPRWIVSFILTVIVGGLFLAYVPSKMGYGLSIVLVSLMLFMLRDAAILHYFKFATTNNRAGLATVFYLAVLYLLLPALLMAAKVKGFAHVFYPILSMKNDLVTVSQLFPILVQLLLVGFLLYFRCRKLERV